MKRPSVLLGCAVALSLGQTACPLLLSDDFTVGDGASGVEAAGNAGTAGSSSSAGAASLAGAAGDPGAGGLSANGGAPPDPTAGTGGVAGDQGSAGDGSTGTGGNPETGTGTGGSTMGMPMGTGGMTMGMAGAPMGTGGAPMGTGGMTLACAPTCAPGTPCTSDDQCLTKSCKGVCAIPTCTDGVKDGSESDVDCGTAPGCMKCPDGKTCGKNPDCQSNDCSMGVCAPKK